MFNPEVTYFLEAGFNEAAVRSHSYFAIEHIVYSLLYNEKVVSLFNKHQISTEEVKTALEDYFDSKMEVKVDIEKQNNFFPEYTPALKRVIENSIKDKEIKNKIYQVDIFDILMNLMKEKNSFSTYLLQSKGLTAKKIYKFKINIENEEINNEKSVDPEKELNKKEESNILTNLSKLAKDGKLDPLVGREQELNQVFQILSRRTKNNPLLVGEPGVGKTSIVNGLAICINEKKCPKSLFNKEILSLNISLLLSGTKYRGEFEERVASVLSTLSKNSILFIDEINMIFGAGSTGAGNIDLASLLKPILISKDFSCIGCISSTEYKKTFEKDTSLSRRFNKININEPSDKETKKILTNLISLYQDFHKVEYTNQAIDASIELTNRYISDKFLPDKAIDILDQAGAENAIKIKNRKDKITNLEIEEVVSKITKVPVSTLSADDKKLVINLDKRIKKSVFGQNEAITNIYQSIKRSKSGLKAHDKPIASFIFAGPSGVGKTELCKVLAKELGTNFIRFDMSEFSEKHTVARLVGAPPGYVGYEEGGVLIDKVKNNPHSVLLLDEIEKAHIDVFNILLQVMDNAKLTDHLGREAFFNEVVLIMTTNAGSKQINALGFKNDSKSSNQDKALKKLFAPEFINRLDGIIYFNNLKKPEIKKILNKFIKEINNLLKDGIKIKLSPDLVNYIIDKGYSPEYGARPLKRLLNDLVLDKLSDLLLEDNLNKNTTIEVFLGDKNEINFKY